MLRSSQSAGSQWIALARAREREGFTAPRSTADPPLRPLSDGRESVSFRSLARSALILAVSALVFGLAHLIPERPLAPFILWALWEGLVLGLVYVVSGSLLLLILLHCLNDWLGFWMMSAQRRSGWLCTGRGSC